MNFMRLLFSITLLVLNALGEVPAKSFLERP